MIANNLKKSDSLISLGRNIASNRSHQIKGEAISSIEGILAKGPYPTCLRMPDRALLAGYPRYGCMYSFHEAVAQAVCVTLYLWHCHWCFGTKASPSWMAFLSTPFSYYASTELKVSIKSLDYVILKRHAYDSVSISMLYRGMCLTGLNVLSQIIKFVHVCRSIAIITFSPYNAIL